MSHSFTLGAHYDALIESEIQSGRYATASDVVIDALRLLEERDDLGGYSMAELRALADEGRASGISSEDGFAFLDRMEAKFRAISE